MAKISLKSLEMKVKWQQTTYSISWPAPLGPSCASPPPARARCWGTPRRPRAGTRWRGRAAWTIAWPTWRPRRGGGGDTAGDKRSLTSPSNLQNNTRHILDLHRKLRAPIFFLLCSFLRQGCMDTRGTWPGANYSTSEILCTNVLKSDLKSLKPLQSVKSEG